MKQFLIRIPKTLITQILIPFLFIQNSNGQNPGEWMWIHGSSTTFSIPNFGVQGVSSPSNVPPGVYEACEWKDQNGNFWLYGGAFGPYADLWKYDPLINEWTWVKGPGTIGYLGSYGTQGVPDTANNPPARSHAAASWVDLMGNLWMFGGFNSSENSDLWRYEISTNTWTWMKGPSIPMQLGIYGTQGVPSPLNEPGARRECSTAWTDISGDLWLFGGYDGNTLNDLWRYKITTNEWTWMKGSSTSSPPGVYGTQGVEDPANTPGARMSHCRWTDYSGNFWMLGGGDYWLNDFFNDLWKFNPLTNNWTWIRGSSTVNSPGSYGTVCTSSMTNDPPARFENRAAWKDLSGNFWTLGGSIDGAMNQIWNDLWMYCIGTNTWTWIAGSNTINPSGNWGSIGVSSPSNTPNGRGGSIGWTDDTGRLFMFGGWGEYNDMWVYQINPACYSCNLLPIAVFTGDNHICPGTCSDFTNLSMNATSYIWSFVGANPNVSTDPNPTGICYNTPGSYDVQLIATNGIGSDTLLLPNYITVYPSPPPQGISQTGDTLFANQGAVFYQWYFNGSVINGATDYYYVGTSSGDYNVIATDTNGCEVEAVINDVLAGLTPALSKGEGVAIFPNPVEDKFTMHNSQFTIGTSVEISIYNVMGERVMIQESGGKIQEEIIDVSKLGSGLYSLEIISGENIYRGKFLKQ